MRYIVYYQEGLKLKKAVYTKDEYENGLLPKNIIKVKKQIKYLNIDLNFEKRIKDKKLKKIFYELGVMLESNILFDDALDILIKNEKDINTIKFLNSIKHSFSSSNNISEALKSYKINPIVKSFFSIIQSSGDVKSNIKIVSEVLNENYEIKKEIKKALFYPLILFITFFSALIGIFKFVVPKFEGMFIQYDMQLSFATKSLFFAKTIYDNYLILILFVILIFFLLSVWVYKKVDKVKYFIDKLLTKRLLLVSQIYCDKVFYEFFLSVENLLRNSYKFDESLIKSKVLIGNYFLLDRITFIENLLKSGKNIEFSASQSGLFDELTLSLLRTGEVSNSLDVTIGEIKNIYKKRFNDRLKLFSLAIEPVFFIIIMALIVWIILAIFVPLWGIGDMLKI